MAAPAGKASGTGALQSRAQKGRVRRAVRISSLVAQEVGDPPPRHSPSLPGLGHPDRRWQVGCGLEGSGSQGRAGRGLLRSRTIWGAVGSAALLIPLLAPAHSPPGLLGLGGQCFSCQGFPSPRASVAHGPGSKYKRRRGRTGMKWVPREDDGGHTGRRGAWWDSERPASKALGP